MSDYNDMTILQNDSDQSVPYYDDYKDMMILQVSILQEPHYTLHFLFSHPDDFGRQRTVLQKTALVGLMVGLDLRLFWPTTNIYLY